MQKAFFVPMLIVFPLLFEHVERDSVCMCCHKNWLENRRKKCDKNSSTSVMMVIICILLVQSLLGQVIGYFRCCLEAKIYKVVPYEAVDCALVGSNTLFA